MTLSTASHILSALFATAGALALYVAATDADWFFKRPDVRALTSRLRRIHARLIYGALGLAIIGMAIYISATA